MSADERTDDVVRVRGRALTLGTTVFLLLAFAVPALAHVTIETKNARPGATSEYTISVPNESDSADTTRVEVQLPDGFKVVGMEPGKGWSMEVDAGVLVIDGGKIAPGERRDFDFTGVNPRRRGPIVFPAIQTYSDGEEVRWVGEEGSDRPAALVTLAGKPVKRPTPPPNKTPAQSASEATDAPTDEATEPAGVPSDDPVPVPEPSTTSSAPLLLAIVAGAVVIALVVASRRRSRA